MLYKILEPNIKSEIKKILWLMLQDFYYNQKKSDFSQLQLDEIM